MKVGYFLPATPGVYGVIREHLPRGCELFTGQEAIQKLDELDFAIAVKMTAPMIQASRRLQLIQAPGVGLDQIDLAAAARAGIPVAVSVAGSSEAVAEHTLLLMLAVCRRLVELANSVRAGQWLMWERRLESYSLYGKTLGLVGFGRIGQEVAKRAAAFEMKVQCYDLVRPEGFSFRPLDELLASSDIISLHLPLTGETRRLLNAAKFALVRPGSILINTARGEIVDERALYDALVAGRLAGAGLDVLEKEPVDPANPLLMLEQVIVTPHVATGTLDSLQAKARMYAENIRRLLAGQEPLGLVRNGAPALLP